MQWAAFLTFVLTACYTPGPNIILAMNTARLFGFKKTLPLMVGMTGGLFVVMTLNAFANIFIGKYIPSLLPALRTIGSVYLLYLAWKMAFPSKKAANETCLDSRVPKIADGFTLQFLNPKVILFGLTSMSTFIAPWASSRAPFFLCGLFLTVNCAVAFTLWALLGTAQGRAPGGQSRAMGVVMGMALAWCALSVSGIF